VDRRLLPQRRYKMLPPGGKAYGLQADLRRNRGLQASSGGLHPAPDFRHTIQSLCHSKHLLHRHIPKTEHKQPHRAAHPAEGLYGKVKTATIKATPAVRRLRELLL